MALPQKYHAVAALKPDISVISECANPEIMAQKGLAFGNADQSIWIGTNPNKGLGVFASNNFKLKLANPHFPNLKFVAPVEVSGPATFNLLAVWAQNASGGVTRKHQLGPLRRALTKYRTFLSSKPTIIGGDLNSNAIWDKPGWRINHQTKVDLLDRMGLASIYHEMTGEEHGKETTPTHYWRDRRKDGPTYHLDYIFIPKNLLEHVTHFDVGSFEDWCGVGMSDHVALVIDIANI